MPALSLPPDVAAVFREFRTCELTTVSRVGQPLTWPAEPFYRADAGELIVTASIAFPVKAYNARRNPKVALLLSDPTGSGLTDPPAVLVQGDATVEELTGDPPWTYEMFKESVRRQPRTRGFVANPVARSLFEFQFQRLALHVQPRRILAWAGRDFSREPTEVLGNPAPAASPATAPAGDRDTLNASVWNARLVACARAYPSGVLTVVEPSGYPCSVRAVPQFDADQGLITFPGTPAAGRQGKASLLFHRHNPDLSGQHELRVKGELIDVAGTLTLRPAEFLTGSGRMDTDRMPGAGSPLDMIQFMLLGRRKSREYLAKRGAPWTPRPWDKMLRYLDEHPSAEP
jgi:hypothetical protein